MVNLTFGEQVKIVLSRKGMTIKHLAEEIENKTGKKMSRQNLTQRLGRDNFQEKDMRMIAEILGCKFELSIMDFDVEETTASRATFVQKPEEPEARDLTLGDYVDMFEIGREPETENCAEPEQLEFSWDSEPEEPIVDDEPAVEEEQAAVEEIPTEEEPEEAAEPVPDEYPEADEPAEEVVEEPVEEEPAVQQEVMRETSYQEPKKEEKTARWGIAREKERQDFQPIRKAEDEDEDRENGDVNPYTGREYRSNSVRMHPKRIGYVQVYDRKDHRWTDMTEWAFLGVEERKKAELGRDYEPPIYLD